MSSVSLGSARSESRYSTASSASLHSLLRLHPHLHNDGSGIQTGAVRSLIRRFEGLGGPAEAVDDEPDEPLSASPFTDLTQQSQPTESTGSPTLSTESRGLELGPSPPPSYFFIGPPDESSDDDADVHTSQRSPLRLAGAVAVAGAVGYVGQPSLLSLLEVSEDDDGPDHRLLGLPQRSAPQTPEPSSPTPSSVKDLWVPIPSPQPLFPRRVSRAGRLARFVAKKLSRRTKPAKARRVEAGCQTDVETVESSVQTPPTHQAVCTVCLATFQEAVVLGCGHSFCRGCVAGLVETRWRAEGRQTVSCPTCRAVHHGPKGLLHRLPPNYALKDLTGP